jgi:four helix bundle protein
MTRSRNYDLLLRTKEFALQVIGFVSILPSSPVLQVLGRQLLRSATSMGAQYREAHRAKSGPDFISKVQGALQELDETMYWRTSEWGGLKSRSGSTPRK